MLLLTYCIMLITPVIVDIALLNAELVLIRLWSYAQSIASTILTMR